jgi:hypothetical protein
MKKITILTLCAAALVALMTCCSQKQEDVYAEKTETSFVEFEYENPTGYQGLCFDEDIREIRHEVKK